MARVIFRASPTIDSAINTSTGGYHITLFQRVVLTIKKKTKQNLFQMRKKIVFMKDFTKVTEHKQPFTSVNQACYLYETAIWIKYTSFFLCYNNYPLLSFSLRRYRGWVDWIFTKFSVPLRWGRNWRWPTGPCPSLCLTVTALYVAENAQTV